ASPPSDETFKQASDRASHTLSRTAEETRRLVRAIVLASFAPLRVTARALGAYVDDVYSRNRSGAHAPIEDLVADLPSDIYTGIVNALSYTADIIPNTIDTFYFSYHEGVDRRASTQATVADVAPRVLTTLPAPGFRGRPPIAVRVTFEASIEPANQDFVDTLVVIKDGVPVEGTTVRSGLDTLL